MNHRELFFKIRTLSHLHRKKMDDFVTEADLHFGQLPILGVLSELGTASQKEIAQRLHVSAPSIANSVKRMEKKGLLTCEVKEDDRRHHVLKLTDKGKEIKQTCFEYFQATDAMICDNISEEDLQVFEKVMVMMINNLKKEKGEKNDD